jgi:hypothetical protein
VASRMSEASTVTSVIRSVPVLTRMSISLFWTYLNLGRQVRKARRAFERQLIIQGMAKEDAERLSVCFEELKDSITQMLRRGIARNL